MPDDQESQGVMERLKGALERLPMGVKAVVGIAVAAMAGKALDESLGLEEPGERIVQVSGASSATPATPETMPLQEQENLLAGFVGNNMVLARGAFTGEDAVAQALEIRQREKLDLISEDRAREIGVNAYNDAQRELGLTPVSVPDISENTITPATMKQELERLEASFGSGGAPAHKETPEAVKGFTGRMTGKSSGPDRRGR